MEKELQRIVQRIPNGNGEEYINVHCHSATLIEVPTASVYANCAASIIVRNLNDESSSW